MIALLVAATCKSIAQPSVGIKGGALYDWNTSTISVIRGCNDCGTFSDGTSIGYFGGFTGEYALFGDVLELSGAVLYAMRPARLVTQSNDNFQVLDPATNSYVPLRREHVLQASLGYVTVEAGLRSRPLPSVPVYIRAVFDAGNPIVDATYTQTEQIMSPEGVMFPDGTQRRTTGSGEFPGLGTSYGIAGGLGVVLPLSKYLELNPEVGFRYGLNSLSSNEEWKQSYATAGLQLRYRFLDEAPPPAPQPVPPLIPVPVPEVAVEKPVPIPAPVTIVSLTSAPLEINETVVTQTFPLLPYIFFDSASAALRERYTSNQPSIAFREAELPKETLPIYYKLLDIVGSRMKQNGSSVLVVNGTSDGREEADGKKRESSGGLSRQRAEVVVEYLKRRWNLSNDRFEVRSIEKPALASNERYAEGMQENRRVELTSADARILAPIVHSKFNEYVATQPTHDFSISVSNKDLSRDWMLGVTHTGRTVGEKAGPNAPPATVSFNLDEEMTNQLGPVVGNTDTLDARIRINQQNEQSVTASTRFPIVKKVSNYEVSRLSLIVFDYDRSDISESNREMMKSVISAAVRRGSAATIIGSTDRLGEMDHNMQLSADRAQAIERFTRTIAPSLNIGEVRGVGPSTLPYDNNLPEGRFYCRTVTLTITTPLR
ncbi:MAG: OmpA family protein [Ignavibacteria bacterium]|nr:OmpA family protein [Ignavibacteria bacterium]